jgi:hypothetical protein
MTPNDIASKPASEATFLEEVAKIALGSSIARDGVMSPAVHADYAVKVAEALVNKLAQRQAGAK